MLGSQAVLRDTAMALPLIPSIAGGVQGEIVLERRRMDSSKYPSGGRHGRTCFRPTTPFALTCETWMAVTEHGHDALRYLFPRSLRFIDVKQLNRKSLEQASR
jgi:hypothetical protein